MREQGKTREKNLILSPKRFALCVFAHAPWVGNQASEGRRSQLAFPEMGRLPGLKQEHLGWFEFAAAWIDHVTQYFEGRDS